MRRALAAATLMLAGATSAFAGEACDYGKPHPDAPPELKQYAFLIGDFRIEGRVWTGDDWSEGHNPARWNGRYILGGMAIMDEWYNKPPDYDPSTGRGVNIRMYNPETERWHLMWQHTSNKEVVELSSRVKEDGNMHLERINHKLGMERKVWFEVYGPNHWARLDHRKSEETGKMEPAYKLEAFRIPCEE